MVTGLFFEEFEIGAQYVSQGRTVTEADVVAFAGLSGDFNPLHTDATFAGTTPFGERIAHGMLGAALLSTVFGTKLPGPGCIYISQDLRFKAPVRIGDTVVAKVTITEIVADKRRVKFACECRVGDTVVIEGEAALMVSRRPK